MRHITVLVAACVLIAITGAASGDDANLAPSPLLAIDQNRPTVIQRIVGDWGKALEQSNAGISGAQLRSMLEGLRADHLLAASLAGSLPGLRDVLATAMNSTLPAASVKVAAKALGDANQDLVYTPQAPCRLFDTRSSQGGLGTPSLTVRRTYGATAPVINQGGPGGCAAPAGAVVALIQIGTLTPSGSGILQGGPQGAASFPNALILYQTGDQYGTAVAMSLNPANGQFDLVEQFATADLYGDLLGSFKAASGFVSNIATGAGLTGGPITTSGTLAADTTYLQRRVNGPCATGSNIQTIAADGTASCQNLTTNATNATTATTAGTITGTIAGSQVTGPITAATISGSQITGTISGAIVPGAVPWVTVQGTSQQAVSNTGYIVTNAAPTAITLPPAPAVGDMVKVVAPGTGGYTITPNVGQFITGTGNVPYLNFIARDSNRNWQALASSADGSKLVAVDNGTGAGGFIYTSTDFGATWIQRDSARNWWVVASSSDGTKLVAAVGGFANSGLLYTSTDSGATWFPRASAQIWNAVASSADGTKLVAAAYNGHVWTSPDSGVTWFSREAVTRFWTALASSADGTKLVGAQIAGQILTSIDSGVTWVGHDASRSWQAVASSSDGTKLAASVSPGFIYTSIDSGANWTPRMNLSSKNWYSVASSVDGSRLAAADGVGFLWTSIDSGVTWNQRDSSRSWQAVASSSDGTRIVAAEHGGRIYTSAVTISGAPSSGIELLYIGSGQWMLVNPQGTIAAP